MSMLSPPKLGEHCGRSGKMQELKSKMVCHKKMSDGRNSCHPHELTAAVVTYTRHGFSAFLQREAHETPLLHEGPLAVNDCWRRGCHFYQLCTQVKVAYAPVNNLPTHGHESNSM